VYQLELFFKKKKRLSINHCRRLEKSTIFQKSFLNDWLKSLKLSHLLPSKVYLIFWWPVILL